MAASSYDSVLELAGSLPVEEQLRLIRALLTQSSAVKPEAGQSSVLELSGLGADVWNKIDAQEYVRQERSSWTG
ncbi:MAG TPA: hypothetical protein VG267_22200 [Terracidiphilus sp.]|nr:hypothetical protein [Terracidiphilus sp.]